MFLKIVPFNLHAIAINYLMGIEIFAEFFQRFLV